MTVLLSNSHAANAEAMRTQNGSVTSNACPATGLPHARRGTMIATRTSHCYQTTSCIGHFHSCRKSVMLLVFTMGAQGPSRQGGSSRTALWYRPGDERTGCMLAHRAFYQKMHAHASGRISASAGRGRWWPSKSDRSVDHEAALLPTSTGRTCLAGRIVAARDLLSTAR
jgi:hypothetical protein